MIELRKYVGIPYAPFGRSQKGCDCWGLVYLFYKQEKGLTLPLYLDSYKDPSDTASVNAHINEARDLWSRIEPEKAKAGSLMEFRVLGNPSHVGIWLTSTMFLHVLKGRNSCIELMNSANWGNRLSGVYEWTEQ